MGGFQSRRPPRSFQGGPDDGGPPAKMPTSNFNQMFGGHGYGQGGGFRYSAQTS